MPTKASGAKIAKPVKPQPKDVPEIDATELKLVADAEPSATTEAEPKNPSPYPEGTPTFTWEPKNGSAPIVLPTAGFDRPDKIWLWSLHRQPFLSQTWAWMDKAKVPDSVQFQAQHIPDDEYLDMMNAWIKSMGGGATAGE